MRPKAEAKRFVPEELVRSMVTGWSDGNITLIRQSGSTGRLRLKENLRDENSPTVVTRSALVTVGYSSKVNWVTMIERMSL